MKASILHQKWEAQFERGNLKEASARRGILPYYRLEGTIRFKLEDIKAFIEAQRMEKKN